VRLVSADPWLLRGRIVFDDYGTTASLIVLTLRMMGTGGNDSSHDDGRDRFEAEN
jgi:hypothetical protein